MARPRKQTPPFVKRVRARGRTYYYFDTGRKVDGKLVWGKLPDLKAPGFGEVYAGFLAGRTRAANKPAMLTVSALVDRYQRSREFGDLSESTQKTYNTYLTNVINLIGNAPADEVLGSDVVEIMDKMADRPGAANMTLGVIGSLYAWASSNGRALVKGDPTKGIVGFKKRDYEPWPEALLAAGLSAEDAKVRLAVSLLYFTAQRIGDVAAARWDDIKSGVLHITQQKTGKMLEIPVHPDLMIALGARPNQDRPLIAREDGGHYSRQSIRSWVQTWAAERNHKVVPHGLRKNAVNALLEAGCTVAETASVSGQSLALVEHYAKRRSNRKLAVKAMAKLQSPKSEQENIGKQG